MSEAMSDRNPLDEIPNPDARLDELEYRLRTDTEPDGIEAALRALTDPYPPMRHRAASALAARVDEPLANLFGAIVLENEEAMGRARAELNVDRPPEIVPDASMRQAACRILAHAQGEAVHRILQQAAGDPDADVRYQALVALHNVDISDEELERTVGARLQDSDSEVATVAAQITAEKGWTTYTEALEKIWNRTHGDARLQFTIALAELAGTHGADLSSDTLDAVVDELTDALGDEETIAGASRALVALGAARAREPLRSVLDRWFVHPLLRVEAAAALVELDDERGREYLADALDHSRDDVRGYALRSVGRLQMGDHFSRLVELAESDDYHADTAILALAEWGTDEALDALEEASASNPDDELRQLAQRALVQRRELGRFEPALFEFL